MSVDATQVRSPARPLKDRLTVWRVVALAVGSLLALVGIGSLLGAGVLGWANATQRDTNGYFPTSTQRFATSAYAITSDRIDFNSGAGPNDWFVKNDNVGQVRIRANADKNLFVGIGKQTDVDRYLRGVAHDEITKIDYSPFSAKYRRSSGEAKPNVPASQNFWVAQASGPGTQTLTWAPTAGVWDVVVMNADATPFVAAKIDLGLRVPFVGWIIGALGLFGLAALVAGTLLLVTGARRSEPGRLVEAPATGASTVSSSPFDPSDDPERRTSPVHLEGHLAEPCPSTPTRADGSNDGLANGRPGTTRLGRDLGVRSIRRGTTGMLP